MRGFLDHAMKGDVLIFAPELLSGTYYYARMFPDTGGKLVEETDRYQRCPTSASPGNVLPRLDGVVLERHTGEC
jgi:hypothetical protein